MGFHILDCLYDIVTSRQAQGQNQSYTAWLFRQGRNRIAQKLGEEAIETSLASVSNNSRQVVEESADLLYHLIVLWIDSGITPGDVWDALRKRFGMPGLEVKKHVETHYD